MPTIHVIVWGSLRIEAVKVPAKSPETPTLSQRVSAQALAVFSHISFQHCSKSSVGHVQKESPVAGLISHREPEDLKEGGE